jgi:hypothetical protein
VISARTVCCPALRLVGSSEAPPRSSQGELSSVALSTSSRKNFTESIPSRTLASKKIKIAAVPVTICAPCSASEDERESDADHLNPSGLLRTSVVVGAGMLLVGELVGGGSVLGTGIEVTGGAVGFVDLGGAVALGDAGLGGLVVGASAISAWPDAAPGGGSAIVVAPSTDAGGSVEMVLLGVVFGLVFGGVGRFSV